MSRGLLLSLDLGTTGVRALVVDETARVLARVYRPLAVAYPQPGHVEQDATDMWERSVEVMRAAVHESGVRASDVAGLGVVTQRSATVAWNSQSLEPLAPVIGWQDQRTTERVAGFRAAGIPLTTLASATKFEWWLQNDAGVRKSAEAGTLRLGTPDVWLTARLCGGAEHVTDPSHASCTALFDNAGCAWAQPLCDLFSVPTDALPRVVPTSGVVGEMSPDLLGAAIPIAARAGDQQAATFAQGVHSPGEAKLTLGTSAMIDLHTGSTVADPPSGAYPLSLWWLESGERAFCLEGTVITAGSAVDWLVELGVASDAQEVDALARSVASSDGVQCVPALQGLGSPWNDDGARAALLGLTRGSGRAQLAHAMLEGLAHRCVDVMESLGLGEAPLRVDGGLARSGFLLQRIADLAGVEVLRAAEVEATGLGAAFLAGLAVGVFGSAHECRNALAVPDRFGPEFDRSRRVAARDEWRASVARIVS